MPFRRETGVPTLYCRPRSVLATRNQQTPRLEVGTQPAYQQKPPSGLMVAAIVQGWRGQASVLVNVDKKAE
jgi:hypothetical protein